MKYYSFMIIRYRQAAACFQCFGVFMSIALPLLICFILIRQQYPVVAFSGFLVLGWLSWTFAEYMIHRFWTHQPGLLTHTRVVQTHLHHHKHPTEIQVTTVQRLLLLIISMVLFVIAVRLNNYFTILAGLFTAFGYSFFSHWMLHQAWSRKIFPRLHSYHIHHHCKHPNRCFGFSTTFWDRIFGTTPPKGSRITERILNFYYGGGIDPHHHFK